MTVDVVVHIGQMGLLALALEAGCTKMVNLGCPGEGRGVETHDKDDFVLAVAMLFVVEGVAFKELRTLRAEFCDWAKVTANAGGSVKRCRKVVERVERAAGRRGRHA